MERTSDMGREGPAHRALDPSSMSKVRHMRPKIKFTLVLVGVLAAAPLASAAPTAADQARAQALVREGSDLLAHGDAAGSRDALAKAYSLYPAPTAAVALAKALVALGQFVQARDVLKGLPLVAAGTKEPRRDVDARAEAARLLGEVDLRIARLHLQSGADVQHVTLDAVDIAGQITATGQWAVATDPLFLNPGHHIIVADGSSPPSEKTEFELTEGEERTIAVRAARPAPAASAEPSRPPSGAVESDSSPSTERAFAASIGGVFVPSGVAGPGAVTAGFLQAEMAWRGSRGDVRAGLMGVYEETYYQSSVAGLATMRSHLYLGPVYAIGAGVALGYGSLSPQNGYNADSGGSGEFVAYAIPAMVRFGPKKNFELALEAGAVALLGFGEVDPFGGISFGFATW
jgi:hypothetical protein